MPLSPWSVVSGNCFRKSCGESRNLRQDRDDVLCRSFPGFSARGARSSPHGFRSRRTAPSPISFATVRSVALVFRTKPDRERHATSSLSAPGRPALHQARRRFRVKCAARKGFGKECRQKDHHKNDDDIKQNMVIPRLFARDSISLFHRNLLDRRDPVKRATPGAPLIDEIYFAITNYLILLFIAFSCLI